MPAVTTTGEQVLEAVVAGPDGANRLYTVTGAASVAINVSAGQQQTQTWTFLVGPNFTRAVLSGDRYGFSVFAGGDFTNDVGELRARSQLRRS